MNLLLRAFLAPTFIFTAGCAASGQTNNRSISSVWQQPPEPSRSAVQRHPCRVDSQSIASVVVNIENTKDRFDGSSTIRPDRPGQLASLAVRSDFRLVYLTPVRHESEDGGVLFMLIFSYSGSDWVFLDGALDLLLDGSTRITIDAERSKTDRKVSDRMSGWVHESVVIPMSIEDLTAIASSNSVELRLRGRVSIERCFQKENYAQLRAVISR